MVRTQQSPKYISNDSKKQQDVRGFSVGIQCWWHSRDHTPIEQHIAQRTFARKVVWTKGCTTLYTELPMSPRQMKRLWRSKARRGKCFLFVFILFAFFVGWFVIEISTCVCIFYFTIFFLLFNFYLIFYYFFYKFPHYLFTFWNHKSFISETMSYLSMFHCPVYKIHASAILSIWQHFEQLFRKEKGTCGANNNHILEVCGVDPGVFFHASLPPLISQTLRTPASLTQQPKHLILVRDLGA